MESFANMFIGIQPLTALAKRSIFDIWLGCENAPASIIPKFSRVFYRAQDLAVLFLRLERNEMKQLNKLFL